MNNNLQRFAARLSVLLLLVIATTACRSDSGLGEPPAPESATLDPAVAEWVARGLEWVKGHPGDVDSWVNLCMTYQANDLIDVAAECYERAVAVEPERAKTWYYLAMVRGEQGDTAGALDAFARSREAFEYYAPTSTREGLLLHGLGRSDEAEAAFRRVADIDADLPAAAMGLALVMLDRGESATAVELLEAALAANPTHDGVAAMLDEVRQRGAAASTGDFAFTDADSTVIGNDPWAAELDVFLVGMTARFDVASSYLASNEAATAVELLEMMRQQHPDDVEVLTRLGQAHLHAGDRQAAREVLEEALALRPNHPAPHTELAAVLEMDGDSEQALVHATRATELLENNTLAWARKAEILRRMGRYPEAIVAFEEAGRLAPDVARIPRAIGDCHTRLGNWPAAAEAYESALALDASDPELQVRAAFAYLKLRRLEEAEGALERALALDTPKREAVQQMLDQIRKARVGS